jgi:RNA polymerase sigma-70 factor (ECF subfamily)
VDGPGTDPLLLSLTAGDERAFALLYDRFAARMYRVALRILGRREDAEDVVQDVFLAVVRSRERLANVSDLTAYLFASLRRTAGRCAVRRARSPETSQAAVVDAAAPVERVAPESPDSLRLQQAIRCLPGEQREVIALKIDGELTFAQIAQIMGVSINTAASRYRYALSKLRSSLEWSFAGGETVMEEGRLPADLEQLERALAAGPRWEPSAALRQRVLREVRAELRRDMRVELQRDDVLPRWQFAAVTAAQVAHSAMQPRESDPEVSAIAKQIQELSPDFLPDESLREARLLQLAGEASSRPFFGEELPIGGGHRDAALQEGSREHNDSKRVSPPPDVPEPDQPGIDPQGARLLKAIENDYA